MKKYLIFIMGIVIGIIGTSYAAYKLTAKEVSFDKSKTDLNSENVQDSIDEVTALIKYGNAEESDIASGKTALVKGKKVTGNFDLSKKIPSIEVSFTLEVYWSQISIQYNELYKSVSIFSSNPAASLLIYKDSTLIGTLTNGQNATYSMEDKKNIIIKAKKGNEIPYGSFVLNP